MIGWRPFRADWDSASARLRTFLPMRYLSQAGRAVEILRPEALASYELVVFEKAYKAEDVALAERLADLGVPMIFDLSDNHFLRRGTGAKEEARRARLDKMLELATLVTASTNELAHRIPDRVCRVVDDALDVGPAPRRPGPWRRARTWFDRRRDVAHLVWFGNSGRVDPAFGLVDLERVIPELNALASRRAFRLDVITDSRALTRAAVREARFPVAFRRWQRSTFPARLSSADLCLLPVQRHEYTVCKSPNRLMTALYFGVNVVADWLPSYEPFARFMRFGCTCDVLFDYLCDEQARHADVGAARQLLLHEYSPRRVVDQWSRALDDALRGRTAPAADA